jgi:zinc protease
MERLKFLLILFLVIPLFPQGTVKRYTLPNGLTVLIHKNPASPVVAIYTWVKVGYLDEPDSLTGISHLLEHMFFKGTKRRSVGEIALETRGLGGILNGSTIYDHTSYYTVLPSVHIGKALDIQSDALFNATIDAEELEKEKRVLYRR